MVGSSLIRRYLALRTNLQPMITRLSHYNCRTEAGAQAKQHAATTAPNNLNTDQNVTIIDRLMPLPKLPTLSLRPSVNCRARQAPRPFANTALPAPANTPFSH